MTAMMEKMLRDPNMQKMLYPYLPEPMRNPQSIEWMLNNPEVRKQMEGVFAQSVSARGGGGRRRTSRRNSRARRVFALTRGTLSSVTLAGSRAADCAHARRAAWSPAVLQGMGMSPEMMSMMSQMDFSQEKVQQQFSELGLKPEDVIQKVLATPDLAAGFSNPKVQQAIFDISQNPM